MAITQSSPAELPNLTCVPDLAEVFKDLALSLQPHSLYDCGIDFLPWGSITHEPSVQLVDACKGLDGEVLYEFTRSGDNLPCHVPFCLPCVMLTI